VKAHHTESHLAGLGHPLLDLGDRELGLLDRVVQKSDAEASGLAEFLPVDLAAVSVAGEVDRAENAGLVGTQWNLSTRIRRLETTEVRRRIVLVDRLEKEQSGIAGLPGRFGDQVEDIVGVRLSHNLVRPRVDEIVRLALVVGLPKRRASVATERLKFRKASVPSLAVTNGSTSGWVASRIPMFAPRRRPPCLICSVAASKICMKLTGPDATPLVFLTTSPSGRRFENENRCRRRSGGRARPV